MDNYNEGKVIPIDSRRKKVEDDSEKYLTNEQVENIKKLHMYMLGVMCGLTMVLNHYDEDNESKE